MINRPNKAWPATQIANLDRIHAALVDQLVSPRNIVSAQRLVERHLRGLKLGADSARYAQKRIFDPKALKRLPLKWSPTAKNFRQIVCTAKDPHPAELAMAFFDQGYICFGTALYWNNLTDQIPTNYYVANERATANRGKATLALDNFYLQDQFIKPARESSRYATFGDCRFTLIERSHSGFLGVINKTIESNGRTILFRLTDPERTLIDCAVAPQRAGGIQTVVDAFRTNTTTPSLKKLLSYYDALGFQYPYWQRIGLIISHTQGKNAAELWRKHFGKPKCRFYVEHGYKADWVVDSDWSVAYPKGLF
jgi:hypothetical protein